MKIFEATALPAKDPKGIGGKMGEIVAVEADAITVVCADGRFKITRVQPADGKKVDAGAWAASANIAVKARFFSETTGVLVHVPATRVREVSHILKAIHAQENRDAADRKARAIVEVVPRRRCSSTVPWRCCIRSSSR